MDIAGVLSWAMTKNCNQRRRTGECDHSACQENARIIEFLSRASRFQGRNQEGDPVSGWLIPDAQ